MQQQAFVFRLRIVAVINSVLGGVGAIAGTFSVIMCAKICIGLYFGPAAQFALPWPFLKLLVNLVMWSTSLLMLASGLGLLWEKPWARKVTTAYAVYALAATPAIVALSLAQGSSISNIMVLAIGLIYSAYVLALMLRSRKAIETQRENY